MATLSLTVTYGVNGSEIFSPSEIYSLYLYGIDIFANDGTTFPEESLKFYIAQAQLEVENWFNLRIIKQLIDDETTSYYRDDYIQQFPLIRTKFPVRKPLSLTGLLGQIEQIAYPQEWLRSSQSSTSVNKRRISIVPTGSASTTANADVILLGITTQIGLQRFTNIPDYWTYQYVTGFDLDALPLDLFNVIGKLASIQALAIAGDLILGAGIASQSLSVDGLSQSISSTASATSSGYNSRILEYEREIKQARERLNLIYGQVNWVVL